MRVWLLEDRGQKKLKKDLTNKLHNSINFTAFSITGTTMWFKREDGANPSRTRRCNRGQRLHNATVGNDGKAQHEE